MKMECRHVSYRYDLPGDDLALADVTLAIGQGEKVAVVGPAGSGKTTLIQLLDALILPSKGEILYDGESVRSLAKKHRLSSIRRRIGVLFQFPEHQFFHETAYEELTFSLKNFFDISGEEITSRTDRIMEGFGMDTGYLRQVSPFHLSSGEKRKLALASALISLPEVLILDEPTAGMDASGRRELIRIIERLEDTTVLIVTHNLEDFLPITRRCIALSGGRLMADIGREDLLDDPGPLDAAGVEAPLVMRIRSLLRAEEIELPGDICETDVLMEKLSALLPLE